MKKLLSMMLAVVLVLSMIGCSSGPSEEELKEQIRQEMESEAAAKEAEEAEREKLKEELRKEIESEMAAEEAAKAAEEEAEEAAAKATETEEPTEEPTEEETEAPEETENKKDLEKPKKDKNKNKDQKPSADWKDMTFTVDGQKLALPFSYADIKDEWTFDLADYGHEDGYILNKGDKTFSTIDLENDKYDAEVSVGFINNDEKAKDILECEIWAYGIDIAWSEEGYPDIELPGGITWGSTIEDVVAAYGEPEDEPYYSDSLKYYVYEYQYEYSKYFKLTIYEDRGLTAFDLSSY